MVSGSNPEGATIIYFMSIDLVDFVKEQANKAYPNPELDPYAQPNEEFVWRGVCADEERKRNAYIEGAMMVLERYGIETLPNC